MHGVMFISFYNLFDFRFVNNGQFHKRYLYKPQIISPTSFVLDSIVITCQSPLAVKI